MTVEQTGRRAARKLSLSEQAYNYIRGEILCGHLPAGSLLPEGAIAEELGISKTPVRQALQTLRREGLLEVGPRRQLAVRGFDAGQRREILEVREALESISVLRACESITVDQIDQLRLLLMQQKRAADAGDEEAFIELDEQFHVHIASSADLRLVARFLSQLRGLVHVMRLGTTRPEGYLHEVHREHTAIVDALEGRRPGPALKALYDHLRHTDY